MARSTVEATSFQPYQKEILADTSALSMILSRRSDGLVGRTISWSGDYGEFLYFGGGRAVQICNNQIAGTLDTHGFQRACRCGGVAGRRSALLARRADRATSSDIAKPPFSEAGGGSSSKEEFSCGFDPPVRWLSGTPPGQEGRSPKTVPPRREGIS